MKTNGTVTCRSLQESGMLLNEHLTRVSDSNLLGRPGEVVLRGKTNK